MARLVESTLFFWWPRSGRLTSAPKGGFSSSALIWTAVLLLVGSVIVAPLVEELYFRGFLLPHVRAGGSCRSLIMKRT